MKLDRTHTRWCITTIVLFVIATIAYVAYVRESTTGPSGGSRPGLWFGVAAGLLMVFAILIGARRRVLKSTMWGSAQFWLRGHLWLSTLAAPIALYHSGFRFGGPLEQVLMGLFAVVLVTGFYGVIAQHVIPRLMRLEVPFETFLAQGEHLLQRMRFITDRTLSLRIGSLSIDGDELVDQLKRTAQKSQELGKERRDEWIDHVPDSQKTLFLGLAVLAKTDGWKALKDGKDRPLQGDYDFPQVGPLVYYWEGLSPTKKSKDNGETPAERNSKTGGSAVVNLSLKLSEVSQPAAEASAASEAKVKPTPQQLLELARKKKAEAAAANTGAEATNGSAADSSEQAPATAIPVASVHSTTKKPSPQEMLEQARKKKAEAEAAKPGIPANTAATPDAGAPAADAVPKKKPSPQEMLEQARKKKAEAEAAKSAAESGDAAAAEVVVSPNAVAPVADAVPKKKPSPQEMLEQARRKKAEAEGAKAAVESEAAVVPAAAVVSPDTGAPVADAVPKKKPSPQEMLEQARKKKAEAANAVDSGPVAPVAEKPASEAAPTTPGVETSKKKQTATEMMAAMKAKSAAKSGSSPPPADGPGAAAQAGSAVVPKDLVAEAPVVISERQLNSLRDFYLKEIRPFLGGPGQPSQELLNADSARALFNRARARFHQVLHPDLETLELACDERRQWLAAHRLHRWLHVWLYLHIPASVAVLVLLIVHAVLALAVVPFSI